MNITESIKRIWSEQQRAVFQWFITEIGNLIVRARAGTGKTTTIIEGIIRFVAKFPKKTVLYAVFNKRNQVEADDKISLSQVTVKTLHGVGFMFIAKVWGKCWGDYRVEWDRVKLAFPGASNSACAAVSKLIGHMKNTTLAMPSDKEVLDMITLKDIKASKDDRDNGWDNVRLCDVCLKAMKLSLTPMRNKYGQVRLSFNDMVWLPNVLDMVVPTFDLVVIDEAQDMSLPQLTMGTKAVKPNGRIVLVGDDRQCIYTFRGALLNSLDIYKEKLKANELGLTVTYRCPKAVVLLAKGIVGDYEAHADAPDGLYEQGDINKLLADAVIGDVVLSRLNAPLMRLCLALLAKGKTARIEGTDIAEDLIDKVKEIHDNMDKGADDIGAFMLALDGWKAARIATLNPNDRNGARKAESIDDTHEMLKTVASIASDVADIKKRIKGLFQDHDDKPLPAIILSSVHKAKGLEWRNVFTIQDTFRLNKFSQTDDDKTELDNLRYVAWTRSQFKLVHISGYDRMTGLTFNQP